jgi:hypothetical protein
LDGSVLAVFRHLLTWSKATASQPPSPYGNVSCVSGRMCTSFM